MGGQESGVPGGRVAWRRVALYYAISFGMVCVLGLMLKLAGANMVSGPPLLIFQLTVAFLYMPMPLVAGLIVERVAGRPTLIRRTWADLKAGWLRVLVVSAAASLGIYVMNVLLTAVLGNAMGLPGVGQLVFTQAGVVDAMVAAIPQMKASELAGMPPVWALYLLGAVGGLTAGFSINGLFAFGEEYGWRGVLMEELAPLGALRANLLTGVMWGLWHAPLILMGFNYGIYRFAGIAMMCVWVTPLSFALWRAREYSGSVLAPAIIHGAFNGSAGFFLMLVASRNPLLAAPAGVVGALSCTVVAAAVWVLTARSIRERASVAEPVV